MLDDPFLVLLVRGGRFGIRVPLRHLALEEQAAGSNPLNPDTDGDGLDDAAERDAGTSPVDPDTDGDRLRDGAEGPAGTDPLVPDTDGDGVLDGDEVLRTTYADEAGVIVELTGVGDLASHLRVDPLTDDALLSVGRGQVSTAYEILLDPKVRDRLTSARISIPFDPATVGGKVEDLRLFTFDEELSAWVPGASDDLQVVDPTAGTVTATVEHFSVYAIFDITNWRTQWTGLGGTCTPTGSGEDVLVDVAFVLDASGSMSTNDPQGLRRTAAKNFVDALAPEDRGAVVRFASSAGLLQGLTSDKALLRAAIDRVNASGGTNIGAGVNVALNELDRGGETGRAEVLILLTDGSGSYSSTLTDRAAADGVTIYTIGLGRAVNATLLQTIASRTGGQYYAVDDAEDLPEVFRVIEQDTGDDGRDTDGDGVGDCDEVQGVVDSATGERFTSDPRLADTDGDGLTDGYEVGMAYDLSRIDPILGTGQVYRVRSDPRQADTDSDGLSDLDELYALTRARSADTDGDGLGDGYEDNIGTDPFFADTDGDDLDDRFEHLNEELGYDPLVADVQLTVWDYAGDFSRGALCGDKTGVWGFCDAESLPYLAGSLAAGFVGVGDIRDALANLVDGNYASAALSVAFLIPVVGDGASVAAKIIKHINKLSPPARKRALTWVMKQDLPDVVKLKVLDDVHGADALQRLRGKGLDDTKLLDLARKGQDLRVLDDAVTGAARAVPSPGRFPREVDAQEWLQRQSPGSRMEVYQPPSGGVNSRRIDVFVDATGQATEVKRGVVRYSSKVKREVDNDVRNLNDPDVDVDAVDWQFFPDGDGKVGPSEELLERLRSENIPFTIWLP